MAHTSRCANPATYAPPPRGSPWLPSRPPPLHIPTARTRNLHHVASRLRLGVQQHSFARSFPQDHCFPPPVLCHAPHAAGRRVARIPRQARHHGAGNGQHALLPPTLVAPSATSADTIARPAAPVAPLVSVVVIALVCASISGQNAAAIRASGPRLLAAVIAVHGIGFVVGHLFARLLGYDRTVARTISIEVGMQNSGLGVVLAQKHFPAEPLAAVPCAISSVVHSVLGSLLAAWWRRRG